MQRRNGLAVKEEMSLTAGRAFTLTEEKDLKKKKEARKEDDLIGLVNKCKTAVCQLDIVYTLRT